MVLAQMYASKLKKEGFDVDIASNGQEGLDKMHSENPSLVLMDVMMPGVDGLEAIRRAKADDQTKKIPILVLSNLSDTNYAQQAVQDGAVDYFIKTEITPAQLVDKVREVLKIPKS